MMETDLLKGIYELKQRHFFSYVLHLQSWHILHSDSLLRSDSAFVSSPPSQLRFTLSSLDRPPDPMLAYAFVFLDSFPHKNRQAETCSRRF